jgi:hypothetical protein
MDEPKRAPVNFSYEAVHPTFLKWMARIGAYADDKYGTWANYLKARLTGNKSPINHAFEHIRSYREGERYDHFDGDVRWHLVAAAYNLMMEFHYATKFGPVANPFDLGHPSEDGKDGVGAASVGTGSGGHSSEGAGGHRKKSAR